MRTRMLLMFLMLVALPANAEERTWTISTGTYTVAAELMEVRGDIAYLKIGDKVEHIPFARLSAADQQYVASQSRPVVFPGLAEDTVAEEALPGPRNEFHAFPPAGAIAAQDGPALNITARKPPIESARTQPMQSDPEIRSNHNYAEELPPIPATSGTTKNGSTKKMNPRALNNSSSNGQRSSQQKKQSQNNASNQNRSRDEERRGLFGARPRLFSNGR